MAKLHPDLEMALLLEAHGAEAVEEGRYDDAGYFFDASDEWFPCDEEHRSLRVRLLLAAMDRDTAKRSAA